MRKKSCQLQVCLYWFRFNSSLTIFYVRNLTHEFNKKLKCREHDHAVDDNGKFKCSGEDIVWHFREVRKWRLKFQHLHQALSDLLTSINNQHSHPRIRCLHVTATFLHQRERFSWIFHNTFICCDVQIHARRYRGMTSSFCHRKTSCESRKGQDLALTKPTIRMRTY